MDLLKGYEPGERIIVFRARQGGGGLGDRAVGAVSAFLMALLTQRQFRIQWESPLPLHEAWSPAAPDRVPWSGVPRETSAAREISTVGRLPEMRQFFATEEFLQGSWNDCDWIVEANQHFFTHLFDNPTLKDRLSQLGRSDPAELTTLALQALFRPTPRLQELIDHYAVRLQGLASLGIQIRTLWNWGDGGGRLTDDELNSFCQCMAERLAAERKDVVFITADDARVFGRLRQHATNVAMFWLTRPILHLDRSSAQRGDEVLEVFANFHLLARCDELVISHWSNFGRLASLWEGRPTWITRKSGDVPKLPFDRANWRQARPNELVSKESLTDPLNPNDREGAQT